MRFASPAANVTRCNTSGWPDDLPRRKTMSYVPAGRLLHDPSFGIRRQIEAARCAGSEDDNCVSTGTTPMRSPDSNFVSTGHSVRNEAPRLNSMSASDGDPLTTFGTTTGAKPSASITTTLD